MKIKIKQSKLTDMIYHTKLEEVEQIMQMVL